MKNLTTINLFKALDRKALANIKGGTDYPVIECDIRFGNCGTPDQSGGGN